LQILLPALGTVFGGIVLFIVVRGGLWPALELKRLIGTIAHDLDFYANRFLTATPDEQREWRDRFRKHACSLREKLTVIIAYPIFENIFQLPPENAVREASYELIGYSNRPAEPPWERLPDARIKELLRIKT
jgi:hypothetical protein